MLIIHFIFVQIYLAMTSYCMLFYLVSSSFRNFIRIIEENIQLRSYEHEGRYLYWIIMMMKEILLILVYVLFACFFKFFGFFNNDSPITQMTFHRWFIEASFFPILFVGAFCTYYVRFFYELFDEYQSIYIAAIIVKVPVFFWMHYAECQSEAFPNRPGTILQGATCKMISKRNSL
jgi:hypothetical protein